MRAARAVRGLLVAALAAVPLVVLPALPAAAEEVYGRPADGVFRFEGHGWGHGHGMNQWGAEGAARQGVPYTKILDAYYPGTLQQVLPARAIRVLIGEDDHTDLAVGWATGLAVKDLATGTRYALPTGYTRWRVVADSAGEHVQHYASGWAAWSTGGKSAWTGPLQFEGPTTIRLYFASGAARDYRGGLRAVRTGTTTINVVNALDLESYLYGVVPRESSSSFQAEALRAQAVAARSYSAYKVDHATSGSSYDICSTTSCQVYGGARYVSSGGTVTQLEATSTNAAVDATKGVTRTYGGKAIFAEFSSSNGGWSTTGSMPYLTANADPWDAIASPNHTWTGTVSAAQLEARYPAVGHLLRLRVTRRDGNGDWGGRVKDVVLEGTDSAGQATSVTATGGGIYLANTWPASSTGLRGSWWRIVPSYGATVVAQSAAPSLVRPPGAAKADVTVTYKNTGTATWTTSGLHLAPAGGGTDPMAGGTATAGTFAGNLSRAGATTVAPGEQAKFVVHLDASKVAAGTYAKSYVPQIGTAAPFGSAVTWSVPVADPVFTSALVGFAGTAAAPTDGTPPAVRSDGTVVLPRNGSTSLQVKVQNTGNVSWPVGGAVRLAGSDERYRESSSYGSEWTSKSQVGPVSKVDGVSGATVVKPGQVAVFPLTLHGNGLPAGLTEESFEAAWFGYAWLAGAKLKLHVVRIDPAVSRLAQAAAQSPALSVLAYPGDKRTVVVRLRNVGGAAWPVNGTEVAGTANPTDRVDALRTGDWLSSTRATRLALNVTRPSATAVYPGDVAEYRVPIDPTDKAAATYGEWFRAVAGATPYGPVVGMPVTVSAATLAASVTRNTRGIKVSRTGVATYVVELKNTGNTTWRVQSNLRLSTPTASPSATSTWITKTRPSAVTANVTRAGATTVAPGEVARFTFTIGGNGRAAGTYTETFGAGWEAWRSTGLKIPVSYVVQ
jgi:SpoIID/LytB domain protein